MGLAPGQTFGPFVVVALAAEGGMGSVYRATNATLGRTVALKVLRDDDGDADTMRRFLREARLGAALDHPNIAAVYDVGTVGATPYLATEWLEGVELRVAGPRLTLAQRLAVLEQILAALEHAHGRGVVHRDLKPANVMVLPDGVAKLVDFGIGKRSGAAEIPHPMTFATKDDVLIGTPNYMAPEQMLSPNVDARADQYAFGVVAYELLAGVHPRSALAGTTSWTSARDLAETVPGLPPSLAEIIHRAMAVHPDDRFPTTAELRRAWLGHGPTALVPSSREAAPRPAEGGPRPRTAGFVFAMSALFVLGLGALAAVLATRSRQARAAAVLASPPSIAPITRGFEGEAGAPEVPPAPASAPSASHRAPDPAPATVRARSVTMEVSASLFAASPAEFRARKAPIEARATPCFAGQTYVPGAEVTLLVNFDALGNMRVLEANTTCAGKFCGQARDPAHNGYLSPSVVACVRSAVDGATLAPPQANHGKGFITSVDLVPR